MSDVSPPGYYSDEQPPIAESVAALISRTRCGDEDKTADIGAAVEQVTALARAYTRGQGFNYWGVPTRDITAVIVTAAARLVSNPAQFPHDGARNTVRRGGFTGWSVAELYALNRYRKRAQ